MYVWSVVGVYVHALLTYILWLRLMTRNETKRNGLDGYCGVQICVCVCVWDVVTRKKYNKFTHLEGNGTTGIIGMEITGMVVVSMVE